MGKRAGAVLPVERVPNVALADEATIEQAVVDAIVYEWSQGSVPVELSQAAAAWFDDTVTLELWLIDASPRGPRPNITFWFDESVEWPASLCEHWVNLAIACGRLRLDATLAKHGLVLAPDDERPIPTRETELFRRERGAAVRFVHESLVWRVEGDRARAELTLRGRPPKRPYECALGELSEELKAKVERLVARNRCACPMCDDVMESELGNEPDWTGPAGYRAELVATHASMFTWAWVPGSKTASLAIYESKYPWIYVASERGARWRYVVLPGLESGDVLAAFAAEDDAGLAWHVVVRAGTSTRWYRSREDGRVWELRSDGVAAHEIDGISTRGIAARDVVAWSRTGKIFASSDGARTFVPRSTPGGAQVVERIVMAPLDCERLYAIVRSGAGESAGIATTADGGVTWTRAHPPPIAAEHLLVARKPRTVVIFGGGSIARSTDAGATWTVVFSGKGDVRTVMAHPDGRLFYLGYRLLAVSADAGATWQIISRDPPTSLAPDLTTDSGLIAFCFRDQYRLTPA